MAVRTQWRVMYSSADPDSVGVQWRDTAPTRQEMTEWREHFICDIWVERRTVVEGAPQRDHSFDEAG